jgi:hypothetical protein
LGVALRLLVVNRAVDLDGELRGWAVQIEHKSAGGDLPAELEAGELPIPQRAPQTLLRRRRLTPHPPRRTLDLPRHRPQPLSIIRHVHRPHPISEQSPLSHFMGEGARG